MELENWYQKGSETLQGFSTDIERLDHLAIGDASGEHLDRVKIKKFISGLRDMYTKRETYANPKAKFAETISYTQTQETAALISRPAFKTCEVKIETLDETNEILKKLIKLLSEKTNGSGKFFKCGKPGHFARDCNSLTRSHR